MKATAIANGYMSGKVFLIWEKPYDDITGYEIYRNNNLIASSLSEDKAVFEQPTMFDHDHHTNLFRKDSTDKLMYTDEKIQKYQKYEYKVIAKRLDNDGNIIDEIVSNTTDIFTQ